MPDFAALRANMVASQLRANDVTDGRICRAMGELARERFVPGPLMPVAYMEGNVDAGGGRVILDPRCFAKLVQLAGVREIDSVLDVGCATGYSTAVLARLAARVVGLEDDARLIAAAQENLRREDAANARVLRGGLSEGLPNEAPFDVIVLNGSVERRPDALLAQLADGGRLVCIVRDGAAGHGCLYVRHDGAVGERCAFDAQAPVLPGFQKAHEFVF